MRRKKNRKKKLTTADIEKRLVDWASTALGIAKRWPRATAYSSAGVIVFVILVFFAPRLFPVKPLRHDDRRLEMMNNSVQQADQRVRSQMPGLDNHDPDYRAMWDTLRDPNQSNVKESSP